ncbi:hypothetical protein HDU83_006161 [Entophlyctis luteolus]|nr:hypothetical protein HDU83_006161 [Entophlyctis luteolus]
MALQRTYTDAACTRPVSIAYYAGVSCTSATCTESSLVLGTYYTNTCGDTGNFADYATALFGNTSYADSTNYASTNCSGSPSGYEADLLYACIPTTDGSFVYTSTTYYGYSSSNCSGSPSTTIPNSNTCEPLVSGGSTVLVNLGTSATTNAAQKQTTTTAAASPSPSPTTGGGDSGANVGAIAGGVVGAVVVIAIAAFFCWRRRPSPVNPPSAPSQPQYPPTQFAPPSTAPPPPAKYAAPPQPVAVHTMTAPGQSDDAIAMAFGVQADSSLPSKSKTAVGPALMNALAEE